MTIVLGLNGVPFTGHDPGAALAIDGVIAAVVEEERLCRQKRAIGRHPDRAVTEVLAIAGRSLAEVDTVAIPWRPDAMGCSAKTHATEVRDWLGSIGHREAGRVEVEFVDHHYAHACSALPFADHGDTGITRALVLDGTGECTSGAAFDMARHGAAEWMLRQEGSLGIYFEALTRFVGFGWGEEGKAMGMAAYGRRSDMRLPPLPNARQAGGGLDAGENPKLVHERVRADLVRRLRAMSGDSLTFNDKADLAFAVQGLLAARVLTYVRELCAGADTLLYAGGFALSCAINREIARYCLSVGVRLVIPPCASDTGVALGAAVAATRGRGLPIRLATARMGSAISGDELRAAAETQGLTCRSITPAEAVRRLFEDNQILGWCDGRAEIGPRALGGRCIVARPDRQAVTDRLNVLKKREAWRPIAPSMTEAAFAAHFPGECPSPFMLVAAFAAKPDFGPLAGVLHVDGSARPQVVAEDGAYRDLIAAAGAASGVEALVCTSFNEAGEPIVNSAVDALRSARSMGLDGVVCDGVICGLSADRA